MSSERSKEGDSMLRTLVNPKGTEALYANYHFSQAIRVGDTIWISGQVGVDADLTPAAGITAQAELAFGGLKRALQDAGATLADVVELTTFHLDLRREIEEFSTVKDRFFPRDFPAWTAVGVTQLALPELRVEVRAVAVAGSAKHD
jgi:enamine deaminase RidA (YjgF/YER057c/UK114 family)